MGKNGVYIGKLVHVEVFKGRLMKNVVSGRLYILLVRNIKVYKCMKELYRKNLYMEETVSKNAGNGRKFIHGKIMYGEEEGEEKMLIIEENLGVIR